MYSIPSTCHIHESWNKNEQLSEKISWTHHTHFSVAFLCFWCDTVNNIFFYVWQGFSFDLQSPVNFKVCPSSLNSIHILWFCLSGDYCWNTFSSSFSQNYIDLYIVNLLFEIFICTLSGLPFLFLVLILKGDCLLVCLIQSGVINSDLWI